MPRKTKDAKSKSKSKPKPKVAVKAKSSAKVVSNIQNKIVIGDIKPKAKRRSTKKGGVVSRPSTTIQNVYQPQVASYAQPSPFMNSSTRLLEEQPRFNLLNERINRLELASLYRPEQPQQQQQNIPIVQGTLPVAEAMAIPEEPMKAEAPDYFDSQYARGLEKAQRLIKDSDNEPFGNFKREPRIPKKEKKELIDLSADEWESFPWEDIPIKSEPVEEPVKSDQPELVAVGETQTPMKKGRKTDREKMETKLRADVRYARDKYNDAVITIDVKSKFGGPLPSNIKRKELWEERLKEAEKALEEFYINNR